MKTNFHISRFFYFKIINFWGMRQNHFWKKIFISTERKNGCWIFAYFKWRRFLSLTLYIFYCNVNLDSGFVIALYPLSSLLEISCRFQFHNLWRAWNGQHWLFHNLALFSIYSNGGTTISRGGVIINLKKYHWEKGSKRNPVVN